MRKIFLPEILENRVFGQQRSVLLEKYTNQVTLLTGRLGPLFLVRFHTYATVCFMLQEYLWTQRITEAHAISSALKMYNSLLPDSGALSATLLLQSTDASNIRKNLHLLDEIREEKALHIDIGTVKIPGEFSDEKTSPVAHLRFSLPKEKLAESTKSAAEIILRITHPEYSEQFTFSNDVKNRLLEEIIKE